MSMPIYGDDPICFASLPLASYFETRYFLRSACSPPAHICTVCLVYCMHLYLWQVRWQEPRAIMMMVKTG